MGIRLHDYCDRFSAQMQTRTRNTSEYGFHYISGLLRMRTDRNFANIGRNTEMSGQNLQHFMSNSTWSGCKLIEVVQDEIKVHPAFQEAILVLDESAEEKAGSYSAGAGRQHNGRLGKVEMSQVGVFLSLVTPYVNTWVDGELFIPAHWFEDKYSRRRKDVGIPEHLEFKRKPELGWQMIQRAQAREIPFEAVVMDNLYGRNSALRQKLDDAGIEYYGDIPSNTKVYLKKPHVHYPLTKRGLPSKTPEIEGKSHTVQSLRTSQQWEHIRLRPNERGYLQADFARCRVWTVFDAKPRQEWLLIRKDATRITYVLSNADENISLQTMAWRKTHRYLIERSNQDAKSELGWDEFQARKYRAWNHQLALTILAAWFIAETRLDWMQRFQHDPALLSKYEVEVLPQLSIGNVRELLRAALPLPQLSPDEATQLVISHLVNRTRSRKSRLRKAKGKHQALM